ncbi:MAG: tetratricopeptide repeat protein, partial [Thermoplasmata archaeon]|nr:tetratricopeptide repeat protein [Thermoplasmata archaeon]
KTLLKRNGFTTLLVVESGAHDERTISTLKHLSEGVFIIEKGDKGALSFRVEALSGARFDQKEHQLKATKRGLEILTGSRDEKTVLKDFLEIPAIDETIARRLYEFGFTNLEKLEKAKKTELTSIPGIDKTTVSKIYEYVHSVEYSKKIIERKSQVWVKRGVKFASSKQMDKAIQSFQRAIEIDPKNSESWFEMARLLYDDGSLDDARTCFDKAVDIEPSLSGKWFDTSQVQEIGWSCPVCGYSIKEENVDCPGCGIVFTMEERKSQREEV